MSYLKKIIAWILIFAILIFSLCAPAFAATDPAPTDSRGDFYDWVINSGALDKDRPGGSFGPGTGGGGRFSKERYDEWVSALPAPGIGSEGCLYWSPSITHYYVSAKGRSSGGGFSGDTNTPFSDFAISGYSISVDGCILSGKRVSGDGALFYQINSYFSGEAPITGYYSRLESPSLSFSYNIFEIDTGKVYAGRDLSYNWSASSETRYDVGKSISVYDESFRNNYNEIYEYRW